MYDCAMIELSPRDARRLALARQGLHRKSHFGRGKHAVFRAIQQLGYVQIDTISVVDRAHHHVLKTRVPNYDEKMLDELQWRDRKIFEYWAHAAAYLPMSDYRFYRPMMAGWRRRDLVDRKLARNILARIRAEGPVQSKDFENPKGRKSNGWWDWKPAKLALENLFLSGELMISRRDGFQKVYDLAENVLPADVDTAMPGKREWMRFIALRMIGALGIGTAMDIGYARTTIRRFTSAPVQKDLMAALDQLAAEGAIRRVRVKRADAGEETCYTTDALLDHLPVRFGKRPVHILSPFDNLVINRQRTQALFDFDYQLECYVPEAKRRYGYFCLPILWGDEFIGRLDAKAVRKSGRLDVRCLHIEPAVKRNDETIDALADGLTGFAVANSCDTIRLDRTAPGTWAKPVRSALAQICLSRPAQ